MDHLALELIGEGSLYPLPETGFLMAAPKPRGVKGKFVKTGRKVSRKGPPPKIAKKLGRKG